MRGQQIIELSIHILFMLLITIGLISLLVGISQNLDKQTTQKKAELILNKVEYNIIAFCFYSKLYNTTIVEFVNLPNSINGHQYEIIGNGTLLRFISGDVIISREANATGYFSSGRSMKITCNSVATISN